MIDKPFCFIASPYAAKDPAALAWNVEYAEAICRRVALETTLIPRVGSR